MNSFARILVWGDLQAHAWQDSQRQDRWKDIINCIKKVYSIAREQGAGSVVFLGDLFESKRQIRVDVMSDVYITIMDCAREFHEYVNGQHNPRYKDLVSGHTVMIAGNHDWFSGRCSLLPFASHDSIKVILKPQVLSFMGESSSFNAMCVPHGSDKVEQYAEFKDSSSKVIFSHCEIHGAKMTKTIVDDKLGLAGELLSKGDVHIFNGHYHMPHKIIKWKNPVTLVGAPMQYNWSDLDSGVRGCTLVDITESKVSSKFIEIDDFPQFLSSADVARDIDFVLPTSLDVLGMEDQVTRMNLELAATYDKPEDMLLAYVDDQRMSFSSEKLKREFINEGLMLLLGEETDNV